MDFDEFIKSHQQVNKEQNSPEKARDEVQFFNERLNELYDMLNKSLEPYISSGSVSISEHIKELYEEELYGCKEFRYETKEKLIKIGNSEVKLTPIGINIIGANGRVDMDGPRDKVTIVLASPGGPRIHTAIFLEGQTPPAPPTPTPKEKLVWLFMVRLPRLHYIEVNEDTLKDHLMKVING